MENAAIIAWGEALADPWMLKIELHIPVAILNKSLSTWLACIWANYTGQAVIEDSQMQTNNYKYKYYKLIQTNTN